MSPRGNVCHVDIVRWLTGRVDARSKVDQCRMKSQLVDGEDATVRLLLDLAQGFQIPRVKHGWFLADRVSLIAKSESDVRVMQVVGRTNADVVYFGASAPEFVDVAIETLELREEIGVGKKAVDNPDTVA